MLLINMMIIIILILYKIPLTCNIPMATVSKSCKETRDPSHYVCGFFDFLKKNSNFPIVVGGRIKESDELKMEKNQYFDIESVKQGNNGQYHIWLNVLDTIEAPFDETVNIPIWDNKSKEKVDFATVNIRLVKTSFAKFVKSTYLGELTKDLTVVLYNGPIELHGGDIKDYNFAVSKEYRQFFNIQLSSTDEVELHLSQHQPLKAEFPISFTLTATDRHLKKTAETKIILEGPEKEEVTTEQENVTVDTSTPSVNKDSTSLTNAPAVKSTDPSAGVNKPHEEKPNDSSIPEYWWFVLASVVIIGLIIVGIVYCRYSRNRNRGNYTLTESTEDVINYDNRYIEH